MSGPVPELRRFLDFQRVFSTYHEAAIPSDSLTYSYIYNELQGMRRRGSRPTGREMRLLLDGYVRSWGSMVRVLGSGKGAKDPLLHNLSNAITREWPRIRKLQSAEIFEAGDIPGEISSLFDALNDALKTRTSSGEIRRSPVGAAKLLHMLLPNVRVIWDREWLLKRGVSRGPRQAPIFFDEDGEGYSSYLREKFSQLVKVARTEGVSIRRFENRVLSDHSRRLKRMFPHVYLDLREPITKILDEANYC